MSVLITIIVLACVASVSARVRRERRDESKKKGMTGEGEGKELTFRSITRLETLATQAIIVLRPRKGTKIKV